MGSRHLASRFGAFTRHSISELGRTTGTQGGRSGGTQGLSWITDVVKAIFRSQSTRSPSMTKSPIGTARLAGMVGACLIVGFAGVTAVRSDAIHVPGTRTMDAISSHIRGSFRSAEASYVPPPSARTPSRIVYEANPPVEPNRDAPEVEVPGASLPPPPPSARIGAVTHVWQTWNNCGPATVTMALSTLGRAESQAAAVNFLKTSKDDKNVDPSELVSYARARGLKIYGATLAPFEGAASWTPEGEAKRQALNNWIRTSGAYDAVLDLAVVLQDPARPTRMRAEYDSGDHLHPGPAGYAAMAASIDVELFRNKSD